MTNNKFLLRPLVAAVFTATCALSSNVIAAPVAWTGDTSNDWMEGSNWNSGQVPTSDVSAQISNGDTVEVAGSGSANSQHLYIGLNAGDGHLVSSGSDLNANEITLGLNESAEGDINASLTVNDADINAPEGINLFNSTKAGNQSAQFNQTNGTLNARKLYHRTDLNSGDTSSLSSNTILTNVTINTTSNESALGGLVGVSNDSDDAHATVESVIGLYDVDWTSNPNLDLEIGSDVRTGTDVSNSSISANTQMTVERSNITGAWLEFGEYTSTRDGINSIANTVTNTVNATFTDSTISLNRRMILGDVGADGTSTNEVLGDINVSLVNTTVDVQFDIQLTDIDVEDGATGTDRAYLRAMNSDISIGELLEIASYGSIDGTGTAVLDAGVILEESTLNVNGVIQVADIASELEHGSIVPGPSDSYTGLFEASNSVVSAQELVSGSTASNGTIALKNAFIALSDTTDPEDPNDEYTLDANEGALTLTEGSSLVVHVNGLNRADAANTKDSSDLYSAIDAVQVRLGGNLVINVNEELAEEDSSIDLIRAVKDDSLTLGTDAFTGIQGEFDSVSVTGLPKHATATTEVVEETIDGTTYDVYRVTFAGSFSLPLLAGLLLLAGFRRSRK